MISYPFTIIRRFVALGSVLALAAAPRLMAAENSVSQIVENTFKKDWIPPSPVLTPREITLNQPAKVKAPTFALPSGRSLSEGKISEVHVLSTPLRKTEGGKADEPQRTALGAVLREHSNGSGGDEVSAAARLKKFVKDHATSGYVISLLIEAGEIEWRHGFFLDSLTTFQKAWESGRGHQGVDDRRLSEMALGRLLEYRALLGQKEQLKSLLAEIKDRPLGGYAEDARVRANEVMWFLDHKAERNVFCGFTAANAICVPLGERPIFPDVHSEEEKEIFIRDGLSAFELAAHSHEANGTLRVVKRGAGAPIVVPSVIHWSFQHYSAITEQLDGKYRVKDDHLRFDSWVPETAIEAQSSGYYLVPQGVKLPAGYTEVSDKEAKKIFGRHCVHARDFEGAPMRSHECGCKGMAVYSFDLMNPGLFIQDTPVGYTPPYGPAVAFTAAYSQRSTVVADLQTFGNLGPRWTHTFQEVISLASTGTPNLLVKWIQSDGSFFDYSYLTASQTYKQNFKERPQLSYLTAAQGGPGYELKFADGSRKLFKQPNLATPTKYLLSQVIDPFGNSLTLQYDSNLRLVTILDSVGQATTISYATEAGDNVPSDTLKIRKVTDPFSRVAKFKYTPTGQLEKIIDPVLIESKFRYASGDFIDRLTTPYDVVEFTQGNLPGINAEPGRFIESQDSLGDRERVEANDFALPTTYNESPLAPNSINVAGTAVTFLPKQDTLYYRNTFFWDKKQMFYGAGDYSKARIYNWLTSLVNTIKSVPGSIKEPLEGRVWFNYPGQSWSDSVGNLTSPSKTVRAVENQAGGVTWTMSQNSYNDLGLPTSTTDPEGREMKYEYFTSADGTQFTNGQDLRYVKVKNGGSYQTLLSISQYKTIGGKSAHLPEIMTDASGVQTTLSYNTKGQVTSMTVSNGGTSKTTNFIYDSDLNGTPDAFGYLIRVEQTSPTNPAQFVTLESRTYDAAKRVRTVTDAEGYTLTYDYDNLDRVTLVTHPDNTTEQLVYSDGAKMTLDVWASKDRAERWTRTSYNHLRQPAMQFDSLNRLTQWEWCKCGSLSKLIDPSNKTTFWKRDIQGRVTEKNLPDAKKYLYTYQPLSGRLDTVAFPAEAAAQPSTTTYKNLYNLSGQLVTKDYTAGGVADVTLAYNDFMGRQTSMTDGVGTTNFTYVPITPGTAGAGQLATVNGPFSHDTLKHSYDALGRRFKTEVLKDDGTTVTRTEQVAYDGLERVTGTTNDLGVFQSIFAAGNLTGVPNSINRPGGLSTVIRRYGAGAGANALRLQSLEHRNANASVWQGHGYEYNLEGEITKWTQPRFLWKMTHDAAGQIESLKTYSGSLVVHTEQSWQYDAAGNMESSTLTRPTSTTQEIRTHQGRNQLTARTGAPPTLIEGTVNEISNVTVNGQVAPLAFNAAAPYGFQKELNLPPGDQVITIQSTDGSGNSAQKSYTVTVRGDYALAYDVNGNLFTKTWRQAGSPGVDWVRETYTWDKENRLKGWEKKRLLVTGVQTEAVLASATWTYDGLGRRVKEQNVAGATVTNTHFIWDGMTMVQWQSATGVAQRNLFDEGEHNVITGEKLIYVKDHLGSVRGWHRLSDGARGEADYSAWGVRTVVSNTTGTMPVSSFTGHYQHAASGLVLAPYRAYDAELGRWLSEDPIGEEGGVNLYGYGPNNPLGGVDPFGADWHHLIPFAAGIDAGLPASFINGAGNGWDMCNADHKALHAAHWTAEWNQFFKNAPKPVSIPAAQAHLDKLRLDSRFASILSKGKSVSGPFKKGASRLAARTASLAAKSRVLPGAFKLAGFFAGFCEMSSDASDNGVSAALRTQRYRLGSMTGQTPEEYDEMANRTSEGFFSRLFQ